MIRTMPPWRRVGGTFEIFIYRKRSKNGIRSTCAQCAHTHTNLNYNMNLNQLNGCKRIKWILTITFAFLFISSLSSSSSSLLPWQVSHGHGMDHWIHRFYFSVFQFASSSMRPPLPQNERRDFRILPRVLQMYVHYSFARHCGKDATKPNITSDSPTPNITRILNGSWLHKKYIFRVSTAELNYYYWLRVRNMPRHAFGNLIANKLKCDLFLFWEISEEKEIRTAQTMTVAGACNESSKEHENKFNYDTQENKNVCAIWVRSN